MTHDDRAGDGDVGSGSAAARLFAGPGEMRALCRARDWGATPLGAVEGWPPALRHAVRLCLDSAFAMCVFAGPQLVLVYNDGYVEALGRAKHPAALGRPAREVWAEVWDQSGPEFAQLLAGGPPVRHEHQRFVIERDGRLEETYWTYAFSPVRAEDGAIVGVHSLVAETTARVHAEAALRESEARFRLMADAVPQIVWITDAQGRVEFFNQQWADYTGRPYEPTTAAEVAATAVHPDDAAVTLERFETARRTGSPFEVEHRIRASAGTYRWFLVRAEPYRDAATGEIVRWFGASVDIHDRKLAEAELARLSAEVEAERERLHALVLSMPAPVALHVGPELRFAVINPAFRQISGGGRDDTGLTVREAFPELPGQGIIEALERVYATGEPWSANEVPIRYDRRGRGLEDTWFDVRYEPVRDAAGAVVGVLNFAVEVTDQVLARREVERLLARSERAFAAADLERRRLVTTLEQLPVGVHVAEAPEGRLVLDNAAVREICGDAPRSGSAATYSADYAGHRPAGHPRAGEPLPSDAWPLARALATGEVVREELVEIRRTDGTRRLVGVSAAPVRDAGGQVVGAVATSVDVTEREGLLAEAEAARVAAEEANRAKGEFLATMSHELRTPLNAIGGYAELLELGIHGPVTDAQRVALARIQTSQRHLLGLIAGGLDYSRVEAGAVTYRLVDVPVTEAISEAETLVAPQLRAKGLGYTWSGAPPELRVRADREKLQQILLNLLSNAVKFTDAREGAPGRIEVACLVDAGDGEDPRVRILVRDTGAGIAAEELERVFEPFVQADQRLTRLHSGVGLGLAISRDLARGMGGDLTAESDVGVGSTFTLTLPAAP